MSRTPAAVPRLLWLTAVLAGALVVATGLMAIVRLHLPVPMRDSLGMYIPYLDGASLWQMLLVIHVDHVVAFQRVLSWMDLNWFNGLDHAALTATALCCLGIGLLAAFGASRDARWPVALLAGLGAAGILLWLGNGYNLLWPMEACFFMVPLFGLGAATLVAQAPAPRFGRLALAWLLAASAVVSVASGLIVPLALVLVACLTRMPGRRLVPFALALLLLLAAVYWGAGMDMRLADREPGRALAQPLAMLDYVWRYLREPAAQLQRTLLGNYQARLVGSLILAAGLVWLARDCARHLRRRQRPRLLAAQGYFLCLLSIGSGVAIALARFEIAEATSERYFTSALLFWTGLLLVLLDAGQRSRAAHRTVALTACVLLQLYLVASLPRLWNIQEERHALALQASAAVLSGSNDAEPYERLYPEAARSRDFFARMRHLRAAMFSWDEAGWIDQVPPGSLTAGDCGLVTHALPPRVTPDGNLALAGWTSGAAGPPAVILLLDGSGRVAALTWPNPGTPVAARPVGAPAASWELWLTPAQRDAGQLAALVGQQVCLLPWPEPD